jgi:hypothetical protein
MISEAERFRMHSRLIETLGQEVADTLMEHLPPIGWADVATRADLNRLGTELRAEMSEFRADLSGEISGVRIEIAGLRGEMTALQGKVDGQLGLFRSEMAAQTRTVIFSVLGIMIATVGAFTALIH